MTGPTDHRAPAATLDERSLDWPAAPDATIRQFRARHGVDLRPGDVGRVFTAETRAEIVATIAAMLTLLMETS